MVAYKFEDYRKYPNFILSLCVS